MKYWFHDIGNVEQGKILEIALDRTANVRIMDELNYENFKNRQSYSAIIYYVTSPQLRVKLPRTAHWYVVIDLEGQSGSVASTVKLFKST